VSVEDTSRLPGIVRSRAPFRSVAAAAAVIAASSDKRPGCVLPVIGLSTQLGNKRDVGQAGSAGAMNYEY